MYRQSNGTAQGRVEAKRRHRPGQHPGDLQPLIGGAEPSSGGKRPNIFIFYNAGPLETLQIYIKESC